GSIARVPPTVSSGRLTQDTVKLEFAHQSSEFARYAYWVLRTPQYRDYCAQRATGSAQVGLSRTDFLSYEMVQPPSELLEVFGRIDQCFSQREYAAQAESITLASLRKVLLQKLVSGELRVRDAERAVERVA